LQVTLPPTLRFHIPSTHIPNKFNHPAAARVQFCQEITESDDALPLGIPPARSREWRRIRNVSVPKCAGVTPAIAQPSREPPIAGYFRDRPITPSNAK
jgi:hypothetical protein